MGSVNLPISHMIGRRQTKCKRSEREVGVTIKLDLVAYIMVLVPNSDSFSESASEHI